MNRGTPLKLGTRGSALALWQARHVAAALGALGVPVEVVTITTRGDRQQVGPIGNIGEQGVFTKELQRALVSGEIDFAVHSLKDLPTEPAEGVSLAATPERGPTADALVGRTANTLQDLPQKAVVGTGSLRRRAQLLHLRPDLRLVDIRGNVDTRLEKLRRGDYDAIVLSQAALIRLQLESQITEVFHPDTMLPAVGQGALGLEARVDDNVTRDALASLNHDDTFAAITAERAMLSALRGGCLAPVGAMAVVNGEHVLLTGVVLSADGQHKLLASGTDLRGHAAALGERVASNLLDQGAASLIASARDRRDS